MAKPRLDFNPESVIRLKKLCSDRNITQKTLSERSGVSQNTISQIMRGKRALSYSVACEIAKAFPPVSPEWLVGTSDCETPLEQQIFPHLLKWRKSRKRFWASSAFFKAFGVQFVANLRPEDFPNFPFEMEGADGLCAVGQWMEDFPDDAKRAEQVLNGAAGLRIELNGEIIGVCSNAEQQALFDEVADFAEFSLLKLLGDEENG